MNARGLLVLVLIPSFAASAQVQFSEFLVDGDSQGNASLGAFDVDADGDLDLVGAAIEDNAVVWWRNDGGDPLAWTKFVIDPACPGARSVFAARIDADDHLDVLATAYASGQVFWYESSGGDSIAWTRHEITATEVLPHEVYADDLDADGDQDVLCASSGRNRIVLWRNDGGSPVAWTRQNVGFGVQQACVALGADLDGDGAIDIAATGQGSDEISWWQHGGGDPIIWTEYPVAALDRVWPLCAPWLAPEGCAWRMSCLLPARRAWSPDAFARGESSGCGREDGGWASDSATTCGILGIRSEPRQEVPHARFRLRSSRRFLAGAAGDRDHRGGRAQLHRNHTRRHGVPRLGKRPLRVRVRRPERRRPRGPGHARRPRQSLQLPTRCVVYFSNGGGGWTVHQEGNFGYGGIATGDANNDGLLDIGYGIHHNYSSTDLGNQLIEVALGDGSGTSWTPWDDGLAMNGETWGMAATEFADFDNDGLLDLVSVSMGCCNGVHVYRNDGDGTWTQTHALTGGNADWCVCTGDINGDGCQDIACAQGGRVLAALWRTDHWESASTGLPASGGYEATQLVDMNSDGHVDLAALGDGICSIWLGDGTGTWTAGGSLAGPLGRTVQAFRAGGDLDHNGYPDVVFVQEEGNWPSYHNEFYVYRESSTPAARFVHLQFPRGQEAFYLGSVQFIRWAAARVGADPATTSIEISYSGSAGPWFEVATDLPDNGRHQWTVDGPVTDHAWLRVTMTQGGQAVSDAAGPFRLLSSNPAVVEAFPVQAVNAARRLVVWPQPVIGRARVQVITEPALLDARSTRGNGPWALRIHDASGRVVRRLTLDGGTVDWAGTDDAGVPLPAGVYTARAGRDCCGESVRQRFVLVR